MSVRVLDHSSLKLITVFLLQTFSSKYYTGKGYSKAQNIRMVKAGRKQRAGKIGCRYN